MHMRMDSHYSLSICEFSTCMWICKMQTAVAKCKWLFANLWYAFAICKWCIICSQAVLISNCYCIHAICKMHMQMYSHYSESICELSTCIMWICKMQTAVCKMQMAICKICDMHLRYTNGVWYVLKRYLSVTVIVSIPNLNCYRIYLVLWCMVLMYDKLWALVHLTWIGFYYTNGLLAHLQ
jgi:hypothetical protein